MRKILLNAFAAGLLCAASAQAGSYTNNFNSASSTNGLNFGGSLWDGITTSHTGTAAWIKSGGAGPIGGTTNGPVTGVAGDGYLQITFANDNCPTNVAFSSYMCGAVLFNDFDPGEIVAGFTFECDLRIGNGNPNPADGFSINFVRTSDPILAALAAGDTFPQMNNGISPNGGQFRDNGSSGDTSLMEEGTSTGLAVGFDMWDSGDYTIPATPPAIGKWAPGFTHDQIGLDISVDDVLIAAIEMGNGTTQGRNNDPYGNAFTSTDPNGNAASTNWTEIETGPYDGTGCADSLSWCHFKVDLNPANGALNVWWKNHQILTNLTVSYLPGPGRLLMGARVGGNTANIAVDNIQITTIAYSHLIIANPEVTPIGVSIQAADSGNSVADTNTIVLTVNGKTVIPTSVTKVGTVTTVAYWDAAAPFPPGSQVTVGLTINDTAKGGPYSFNSAPLTVAPYLVLTPAMAVTNVDTTQPGFNVKGYHVLLNGFNSGFGLSGTTPTETTMENSVRRAEEEMAGLLGPNDAAPSSAIEPGAINYCINTNAPEGGMVFPATARAFPGVPQSAADEEQIDNFAYEFTTIIYFPEQGVYELAFNSDDGFRMTAGNPATDRFNALLIGQYDGGRGSSSTSTEMYVAKAGYYPFRTIYFQGNGGATAEWIGHELYPTSTTNALINDTTSPTALLSYRSSSATYPAAVTFIDPVVNSGTYQADWPLEVQISDGSAGAISAPALYLNGAAVTPTTSKSGGVTTLTYKPATLLPAGANMLGVTFKDASGTVQSNSVAFNVFSYTVIPPSMALSAANVDTTATGFDVHTYLEEAYVDSSAMSSGQLPNNVYPYELEQHGFIGWPNAADFTVNWQFNGPGDTNYVESNVICYTAQAGQYSGHYADAGGAGANMPGIPGVAAPSYNGTAVNDGQGLTSELSLDIKTVIYLTPGLYTMDVNSDDGFSVSVGNPAEWRTMRMILGEADYGRGSSDTAFNFYITKAGYYPFTCAYFGCPGGNEVEWMTVSPYPANNLYYLINDATAALGNSNPSLVSYQYPFAKSQGSPYVASYGPSMFHPLGDGSSIIASTHAGYDAPIWANLVDGDNAITTSSVNLWVNGTKVTPQTLTKTGNTTTLKYTPPSNWTPNTTNTVTLSFLDRTNTWSFMVENHPNATFFIEAEDVDSGGKSVPAASIMPYWGGAYAGMPATLDVDYHRGDQANGPWYRLANSLSVTSAAPLSPNIPMQFNYDMDRGVNEVQSNFRIGWIGSGQWYNYTRTFPTGKYNVYGGISNGGGAGTGEYSRYAVLQIVSATSTNNVGIFGVGTNGLATGQWGQNGGLGHPVGLVPLTDPNGNMVTLDLSGTETLRYWLPASGVAATVAGVSTTLQNGSGDWDFMMFTPAAALPPSLSIAWVAGKAVITYQGTLASASVVNGTYTDVAGATSPYTVPAGSKTTFYRAHN
jgi:hypothetical protein